MYQIVFEELAEGYGLQEQLQGRRRSQRGLQEWWKRGPTVIAS